jgi:hypothetical protein
VAGRSGDKRILFFDFAESQRYELKQERGAVEGEMVLSPDNRFLAAADFDRVWLYDASAFPPRESGIKTPPHTRGPVRFTVSGDGRWIVCCERDGTSFVTDVRGWTRSGCALPQSPLLFAGYALGPQRLITASENDAIGLWGERIVAAQSQPLGDDATGNDVVTGGWTREGGPWLYMLMAV